MPAPGSAVVGIGARRGITSTELRTALAQALIAADVSAGQVVAIGTVDAKRADLALQELADLLGVPLRPLPVGLLARQVVPNPSGSAQRLIGTPSVAEAAVLALGAELVLPKRVHHGITVAVGRLPELPAFGAAAGPETSS